MMLEAGAKVGLVCCSNPRRYDERKQITDLEKRLSGMGLIPVSGDYLYEPLSGAERAEILMDMYRNEEIKAIFDVSGGDIANGVLPYLDFEEIAHSNKVYWGYSDLTTLVNSIYTKTGKASVLYQIRNIVSEEHGKQQSTDFQNTVMREKDDLFRLDYELLQGDKLQGVVVGGNTRSFLKLAGTPYMPDLTGKILLLEARSGLEFQIETYMAQLAQIGAFEKVSGVLLGTFSKLEAIKGMPRQEDILKKYVREDLPVAVTRNIGHGTDSKAVWIGKEL